MIAQRTLLAAVVFTLCVGGVAQGHFLWLERDGDGPARAYFGEYTDDLHEKAGGLLDRFKNPRAFLTSIDSPISIEKRTDGFFIAAKGAADLRVVEDIGPRPDSEKGGRTRTIYYAKAGRSEMRPKMDLELVPVAANGKEFTLLFRDAPLAKIELTIAAPSKWEKRFTTDERGHVTLPMPWTGRYVIEVVHFEEKPGGDGDGRYDRTRHISSISFLERAGMRWMERR